MSDDLDAVRERHKGEHVCVGSWADPDTIYDGDCDAALFRDALDEMTAARDGYADLVDTLSEQEAAARALADELRQVLSMVHSAVHCAEPCDAVMHDDVVAALAKREASK